jgi:PAS domain S-box-containing protein
MISRSELLPQDVAVSPAEVKILLVDDSPENLFSLEAALENLGEVVLAHSGKEALRHLLENDFGAILLDVKMPEMDGFQTAEMIRSRKRSRHTPILFLTAYRSDEQLVRGYAMGAVDFLFKPIVPEILRSKVGVFVELTRNTLLAQRQAEALRKTEQKFRSLLAAAPDALIISSEEGSISLINAQVEAMFGYHRRELLGQNLQMIVPDWKAPLHPANRVGAPNVPPLVMKELIAFRKNGTAFPVEINVSPLQTEEDFLIISAIRDVTERRRNEDQIRELNANLEQRVAERTHELGQTNEALRQSNEDLNQFAYAASHDLQEPLRMVALYSEILREKCAGQLGEEADGFISSIIGGARRMEMLLKDLLAYSQVGSAAGPAQEVDCNLVMQEVLLNLGAAVKQNEAEVTWDELPTLQAHPIRLVQLFQNLVGNAIKYRRDESPRIHVSAERGEDRWLFVVDDNGIGIKPEYARQIFGVFKRLHGRDYPGTGIGLAICQRIVERYDGRIWVESKPGQGSRFCFWLPATADQGVAASAATAEVTKSA